MVGAPHVKGGSEEKEWCCWQAGYKNPENAKYEAYCSGDDEKDSN
jgi:hypothetical protein